MESLTLLVSLIFLSVLLSGPLAITLLLAGYPYVGGTLGAIAAMVGIWWACTVSTSIGWVGLLSSALGLWSVLQAWRHDTAQ